MTPYAETLAWLGIAFLFVIAGTCFYMAVSVWRRPRPKPPPVGVWQTAALLRHSRRGQVTVIERTSRGLHRAKQRCGRHTPKYLRLVTGSRS